MLQFSLRIRSFRGIGGPIVVISKVKSPVKSVQIENEWGRLPETQMFWFKLYGVAQFT